MVVVVLIDLHLLTFFALAVALVLHDIHQRQMLALQFFLGRTGFGFLVNFKD